MIGPIKQRLGSLKIFSVHTNNKYFGRTESQLCMCGGVPIGSWALMFVFLSVESLKGVGEVYYFLETRMAFYVFWGMD